MKSASVATIFFLIVASAATALASNEEETLQEDQLIEKVGRLEKKFGIKIVFRDVPAPTASDVATEEATGPVDFAKVAKVLTGIEAAFNSYSPALLKLARISRIAIVKKLDNPERAAPEMADPVNHMLYFNCSIFAWDPLQNREDYPLFWRYITHHGVGHMIDFAVSADAGYSSADDPQWKKLGSPDFEFGKGGWGVKEADTLCFVHPMKGFVNKYAMSSMMEDKAEVFVSLLMKEPFARVREWAESDDILSAKLKYMRSLLSKHVPDLDDKFWKSMLDGAGAKPTSTWLTPLGWLPAVKSGFGGGHVEKVDRQKGDRVVYGVMLTGKTVGTLDACLAGDTAWFVGHVGDVIKKLESPSKGWDLENCKSVTSQTLWGIQAFPGTEKVWICGGDSRHNGASIWFSEDGGKKWKSQFNTAETFPGRSLLSTDHLNKFFFFDEKRGFAVGGLSDNTSLILKTSDGKEWKQVYKDYTTGTDDELRSIWFSDAKTGCAVGHSGAILMTDDGGETWKKVKSGTEQYLYTVRSADKDTWFISAGSGIVLKSTDGGKRWEELDVAEPSEHLYALAISGGKIWTGGEGGAIYVSEDQGKNWKKQQSNVQYPIHSIAMIDGKRGIAACASNTANLGAILLTYTGGE